VVRQVTGSKFTTGPLRRSFARENQKLRVAYHLKIFEEEPWRRLGSFFGFGVMKENMFKSAYRTARELQQVGTAHSNKGTREQRAASY